MLSWDRFASIAPEIGTPATHRKPVNLDKPQHWKEDIARSVDLYNDWFLRFAPLTYRQSRARATLDVERTLEHTNSLRNITPELLQSHPTVLFTLRMSTAPPIARDRLVGLAGVSKTLVKSMELHDRIPPRANHERLARELRKICDLIMRLADEDIFPWLGDSREPTDAEKHRAATIVADRLCGAQADPLIRNAQEQRQLAEIKTWLEGRGYRDVTGPGLTADTLPPGTLAFRLNVPGHKDDGSSINIPIDAVVMPHDARPEDLPLLIEAKSAGDFTNTNKRRKEEAVKISQLRRRYGGTVRFILFLCGYFDSGYLGYEAAEGIDWVWEHRIDDLAELGL